MQVSQTFEKRKQNKCYLVTIPAQKVSMTIYKNFFLHKI